MPPAARPPSWALCAYAETPSSCRIETRNLEQVTPELVGGRQIAAGDQADEEERGERGGGGLHEHHDDLVADGQERRGSGEDLARHHPRKLHEPDRHHPVDDGKDRKSLA